MTAAELSAAGADVVLADLTAFPAWLDSYLLATVH
jgi:phosphoglycolate phosphatase